MIPFLFLFLLWIERTCALVVIGSENRTYLHTQATFSRGYVSGRTYGQLILSEPRIACEEITIDVRDRIVLVERYNKDHSCPYEKQAFIAQSAGALSVVLMDNEYREGMLFPSPMNMTIAEQVAIPVVYISKSSSDDILCLLQNTTVLYVNITEETEYKVIERESHYAWLYITFSLVLLFWIWSTCYYSDHAIVRRIANQRKSLYNKIRPVIYSKKTRIANDHFQHLFSSSPRPMSSKQLQLVTPAHDACPICLSEFVYGDVVKILPCNHMFHMDCLDPWYLKQSASCPVCKMVITKDGMRRLDPLKIDSELMEAIQKQKSWRKFWWWFWIFIVLLSLVILSV
ncbi:hypothetical protein WA538_002103, partial [Blastocystis sp. DL]